MAIRRYRKRKYTAEQNRRWNLKRRYSIDEAQYKAILEKQRGLCGLCGGPMARPVIDHDHSTGNVRGILCHHCNIKLPIVEDTGWIMLAWAYLEGEE